MKRIPFFLLLLQCTVIYCQEAAQTIENKGDFSDEYDSSFEHLLDSDAWKLSLHEQNNRENTRNGNDDDDDFVTVSLTRNPVDLNDSLLSVFSLTSNEQENASEILIRSPQENIIPSGLVDLSYRYKECNTPEEQKTFIANLNDQSLIDLVKTVYCLDFSNDNNRVTQLVHSVLERSPLRNTLFSTQENNDIPFDPEAVKKALTTIALQLYKTTHRQHFTNHKTPYEHLKDKYGTFIEENDFLPSISIQNLIDNECAPEILSTDDTHYVMSEFFTHANLSSLYGLHNLAHYEKLKCLSLSGNQLTHLTSHCFDGLVNLEELWLSNNKITFLASSIFTKLTELKRLALNNNELAFIAPDAFRNNSKLEHLNLESNKLTALDFHIFDNLRALKSMGVFPNPFYENEEQKEEFKNNMKTQHQEIVFY